MRREDFLSPQVTTGPSLGSGKFGSVFLGTVRGQACAVKCLTSVTGVHEGLFMNELCALFRVRHENVVGFIGMSQICIYLPPTLSFSLWIRTALGSAGAQHITCSSAETFIAGEWIKASTWNACNDILVN